MPLHWMFYPRQHSPDGVVIIDGETLVDARSNARRQGFGAGVLLAEGRMLTPELEAVIAPEEVGRLLSLSEANAIMKRFEGASAATEASGEALPAALTDQRWTGKPKGGRAPKWFFELPSNRTMQAQVVGWLWRFLINIIQLAVVIAIFSELHGQFEVVAMSVLGIIYLSVRSIGIRNYFLHANLAKGLDNEIIRLHRLLADDASNLYEESRVESHRILQRKANKIYFDSFFLGLIWIVCIYHIFRYEWHDLFEWVVAVGGSIRAFTGALSAPVLSLFAAWLVLLIMPVIALRSIARGIIGTNWTPLPLSRTELMIYVSIVIAMVVLALALGFASQILGVVTWLLTPFIIIIIYAGRRIRRTPVSRL
jgi:hypothetical protein